MTRKIHVYNVRKSEIHLHPKDGKKCSKKSKCVVGDVIQGINEFGKRSNTPDGRNGTCKSCIAANSERAYNTVKENDKMFREMFI